MGEYIEREAAIATIMSDPPDAHYPHWYADKIKAIPADDVAPVRHGRWICRNKWKPSEFKYECSICHDGSDLESKYCPNCGAKMRGSE